MSTFSLPFSGGDKLTLPSGAKFYLLDSTYPVDIDFLTSSGTKLEESAENVEAGFWSAPKGGFGRVQISSATAQTVKVLITRGDAGYDRAPTSKPDWYDRNPLPRIIYLDSTYTFLHSWTQRKSYTVPAGRAAIVHSVEAIVRRESAATSSSSAAVAVARSTASEIDPLALAWLRKLAVGDESYVSRGGNGIVLRAGDPLYINTYDGSDAGYCNFQARVALTEFDA